VTISQLREEHVRKHFDCGVDSLIGFLRQYAGQNERRGLTRTHVATAPDSLDVVGYLTIRVGEVACEHLPEQDRKSLPRYPVPVMHIARLAIDRQAKGQGLGTQLLMRALRAALTISERVGLFAVEVVAKDAAARAFYERFGFKSLVDDELHLYLPLATVRKAFA